MRAIDQALVDEVWRETAAYPPGRVEAEAGAFLAQQPHVAAFAQAMTREQDPAVQKAALGLCFLLFKTLERSLGQPFPLLAETRIVQAHAAISDWLSRVETPDAAGVLSAADDPGHPTLVSYILGVFYGATAVECDDRVRAILYLMLRTLSDALDLGQVEA
ncbi:MAG TPA: hypothetical protein VFO18_15835 [Methylomirabilota bacterium]|nr:hypothetical protein [Methylomirabilota bacterium]